MQRQRSAFDSFSEGFIDRGCVLNNAGMSQQTCLNKMLNPEESRLMHNMESSGEAARVNAINSGVQTFSGWNAGASSSSFGPENQVDDVETKMEEMWLAPSSPKSYFGPTNVSSLLFPGRAGIGLSESEVRSERSILHGSSPHHAAPYSGNNTDYVSDRGNDHSSGALLVSNYFHPGRKEIEQVSHSSVSSDDVGNSSRISGCMLEEGNGYLSSSLRNLGLSCKRKALEGASGPFGHLYAGGSSTYFPQAENSTWDNGPTNRNASSGSLWAALCDSRSVNPPEPVKLRSGFVASGTFSSSRVAGNVDHLRNFGRRINSVRQQEPSMLNLSITGGPRYSNVWSPHQSPRPVQPSDSLDLRSTSTASNSSGARGQSHATFASAFSRNMHPLPWTGPSNLRSGNPSRSLIPGERVAVVQEEVDIRSTPRYNVEHPIVVPPIEMGNSAQNAMGWNVATGNMHSSGSVTSSRGVPSSSIHPVPTCDHTTHNQRRSTEFSSWSPFLLMDTEAVGHSGHFPSLSSGPSTSSQGRVMPTASSSQGHGQPFPSSACFMEGRGDDAPGFLPSLRALAADIGRRQLILEDDVFDPFIHDDLSDMDDSHREMRLDIDSMSYEELLALEERIGDVSTGLSAETISRVMKQKKHMDLPTESPSDVEPCCICQEEFVNGDYLGMLDCGHDFHVDCIKQWLTNKNLCPICKMTAVPT